MTADRFSALGDSFTLRCRWLVPMAGPPIEGAWLQVERGRIAAIAPRPIGSPETVIDLDDAIVLPGLVNAHTHLEFSAIRSPLDATGGLPGWIARVVAARRERSHDPASVVGAIRTGLAESAAAGVTTIGDIATTAPPAAYAGPGPRVRVFREGLGLRHAAIDAVSRAVTADIDRLRKAGIPSGISPHAPYSVASALGRQLLKKALESRLPIAMHVLESEAEAALVEQGSGPFRRLLADLGAWDETDPPRLLSAAEWISRLARCPRGIVVHATHIGSDSNALDQLARHRKRLTVVVCPRTTQRISNTLPPLQLLKSAGIRIAIGTDSRASNPDLSVLAECRALVDAGLVSPEESLRMTTTDAAWALNFEDRAGSITVGRPADLVILRPTTKATNPYQAAIDPDTKVASTFRRGVLISGNPQ